MLHASRSVLVFAVLIAGCSRVSDIRLGTMLTEWHDNEVAADQKYQSKRVRVRGVVADVGIAKRKSVHYETSHLGFHASTDSEEVTEHLAYVEVLAEKGVKGRAVGYFEPKDRSQVADVRVKSIATIVCEVSNFEDTGKETVVYMSECKLEC